MPVDADRILAVRRWEDQEDEHLWTTFNGARENLLNGGLRGRGTTGRRTTTRAVGGVNENVKLNKALWTLAGGLKPFQER